MTPVGLVDDLLEAEDARLLSEVGFHAISKGMIVEARCIFEGLSAARPRAEIGYIGLGLCALAEGDAPRAVEILRGAPMSEATDTFLALALARAGESLEAQSRLADIAASADEPAIAALARAAKDEI